jgi:hypothetical protein
MIARQYAGVCSLLLVGLMSVAASGQEQPRSPGRRESTMSMDAMMQQCRDDNQAASTSMQQMMDRMQNAERSNDPATMQQVLRDAQRQMAGMQQSMSQCASMMQRMGGMSNGMRPTGTAGEQGATEQSSGMMSGMMGSSMRGMGWLFMTICVLLALSLTAALIALTVFLWNRSRVYRPA